jgi:hypothetical protein
MNYAEDVCYPEYQRALNQPSYAAYVAGRPATIQVMFKVDAPPGVTVSTMTIQPAGRLLDAVEPIQVPFTDGYSQFVEITIDETWMPTTISRLEEWWYWDIVAIPGYDLGTRPVRGDASGPHVLYSLFAEPTAPWMQDQGDAQNVWVTMLDHACRFAVGVPSEDDLQYGQAYVEVLAAQRVTEGVFFTLAASSKEYDGFVTHCRPDDPEGPGLCDLTTIVANLEPGSDLSGLPAGSENIDCQDASAFAYTAYHALGLQGGGRVQIFPSINPGIRTWQSKPLFLFNGASWRPWPFFMHQFLSLHTTTIPTPPSEAGLVIPRVFDSLLLLRADESESGRVPVSEELLLMDNPRVLGIYLRDFFDGWPDHGNDLPVPLELMADFPLQ